MNKIVRYIILTSLILFICKVITTLPFLRFWADDFCSSVFLNNNGYLNSQVIWWKSWTGRYSYIAVLDLVLLKGLMAVKVLPFFLIAIYFIPLYFIFGIVASSLLVVITILNSPNIIQTLYWTTGSLNYYIPFVFLNLFLLNVYKNKSKLSNIISFLLMFIASGFSESFAVATLFFFMIVFISIRLLNSKLYKIWNKKITIGLLAIFVSLAIMYLSPGNAVRSSLVSHPESFSNWFYDTFIYSRWFLASRFSTEYFTTSLVILFLLPIFFNLKNKVKINNIKAVMLISLISIPTIIFLVAGITYYALNWEPPERVMFIAVTYSLYLFGIFSLLFWYKYSLPNKVLVVFKLFFILNLLALTFYSNKYLDINKNEIKEYANKWDKVEDLLIASRGSDEVSVQNIKPVGKLDGFVENKGWVLSCIKAYYHTGEIIVK